MHNHHDDHRDSRNGPTRHGQGAGSAGRDEGQRGSWDSPRRGATSDVQGQDNSYGYGDDRYSESRDRQAIRHDEEGYRSVHGQRPYGGGDRGIGYGDYDPPRGQERYAGGADYRDDEFRSDQRHTAQMGNWRGQADDDMLRRVGSERNRGNLGRHHGHSDYHYGNADYGARGGDSEDAFGRSLGGHGDVGPAPPRSQSHYGRGPKDYVRSDERIREDLCERLSDDHHLDASELYVEVREGVVTLSGSVSDRSAKRRAEDIADQARGVKDVINHISLHRAVDVATPVPNNGAGQSTKQ